MMAPVTQDSSMYRTGNDSSTTKISLPASDTPVQRRNQEFRKGSGGNTSSARRRSSLGLRGRRASSMMSSGIVAEPHAEVPCEEFYKHIGSEEMENMRFKQALSWTGRRVLDSSQNAADDTAHHIARLIQEDLLKEIATNGELTTWFTRADSPAPAAPKKPNPKNEQNRETFKELQMRLEELDMEHDSWISLREMEKPDLSLPSDTDEYSAFLRPEDQAFAQTLSEADDILSEARRIVKSQASDIRFQIDRLADGVHRLLQYGEAADQFAGTVLAAATEARERDAARLRSLAGTDALPLQEVLRSISQISPPLNAP